MVRKEDKYVFRKKKKGRKQEESKERKIGTYKERIIYKFERKENNYRNNIQRNNL